ncbi:MAG TPA: type I methionyl aminopeptidase [Ignavibacteria bacterium]|nr:type I methionyl aminopeptidase [Ignavibacteria bacterium]
MSLVKNDKEIELIRDACKIVRDTFEYIKDYIKEGVTTFELDLLIENKIKSFGGYPAFKGYRVNGKRFPASACISLNSEVVHGIPSKNTVLANGDIISIDIGVLKNGYHGDSANTFAVGEISAKKQKLLNITNESLFKGIEQAKDGNEVNDISSAIQNYVEGSGFSIVRELIGHGVGKKLHEEPPVPNYYNPNNKYKLLKGMVLAIEPMVNYGSPGVKTKSDGWTVVTADGEPSAHFEHTVLITESYPEVLTI